MSNQPLTWTSDPARPGLLVCRTAAGQRLATVHKANAMLSFGWPFSGAEKYKLVFCIHKPGLPKHGCFFTSIEAAQDYAAARLSAASAPQAPAISELDVLRALISQQHVALQSALKAAPWSSQGNWARLAQDTVAAATPFIK